MKPNEPPFSCIYGCGEQGPFKSEAHILPAGMGNDLLALPPGWVCDPCNNGIAKLEKRILEDSVFGVSRVAIGVPTRRGGPADASFAGLKLLGHGPHPDTEIPGISLVETPTAMENGAMFSIDQGSSTLRMVVPVEKTLSEDIGRFLLKVGLELAIIHDESWQEDGSHRFAQAARYVRGRGRNPKWNYAFLPNGWYSLGITSVFRNVPDMSRYIKERHFDFSLVEINDDIVFFLRYVFFNAAVCLTSRSLDWLRWLDEKEGEYIVGPTI